MFFFDSGFDKEIGLKTRDLLQNGDSYALILSNYSFGIHLKFLQNVHFQCVMVEEGHRASNPESGIYNKISRGLKTDSRIIISGTIIQSRLGQFLTMLKIVDPEIFARIENCSLSEKDILNNPRIGDLFKEILGSTTLRREITSLADGEMPEVDEHLMLFKLSPKHQEVYNKLEQNGIPYQMLRQCTSGLHIDASHELVGDYKKTDDEKTTEAATKFNGVQVILEQELKKNNKVLMFGVFVKSVKWLKKQVEGLGYPCVDVYGRKGVVWNEDVSKSNEAEIKKFKHDPTTNVCVATYGTLGYGINVQEANVVIFYEMSDTATDILQAKARIIRLNQQKRCKIYYMVTLNTVEHKIYFQHFSSKVKLNTALVTENKFLHVKNPQKQVVFLEKDVPNVTPIEHCDSAAIVNEKTIDLKNYAKNLAKPEKQGNYFFQTHE